ncbi:MAG: hypothetical protein ACPL1I_08185, partial [bacterium]
QIVDLWAMERIFLRSITRKKLKSLKLLKNYLDYDTLYKMAYGIRLPISIKEGIILWIFGQNQTMY